jgi:hypothetical protein
VKNVAHGYRTQLSQTENSMNSNLNPILALWVLTGAVTAIGFPAKSKIDRRSQ